MFIVSNYDQRKIIFISLFHEIGMDRCFTKAPGLVLCKENYKYEILNSFFSDFAMYIYVIMHFHFLNSFPHCVHVGLFFLCHTQLSTVVKRVSELMQC